MDLEQIETLIKLMQKHQLSELEFERKDTKIRLVQSAPAPVVPSFPGFPAGYPLAAPVAHTPAHSSTHQISAESKTDAGTSKPKSNFKEIRSPFVGTYYGAASPGADPFVEVGKKVKKGDTLCIVEAMKLMNEIEAEHAGTIIEVLVQDEEPVEFNQLLFLIE